MPNWCVGELAINGDKKQLDKFRKLMGEKKLDADKIIPYPAEFKKKDKIAAAYEKAHPEDWRNRPKDGYNSGGYDWCIGHWGTKWGFCEVEILTSKDDDYAEYTFMTAWSPITPVIRRMGEMFPKLKFSYTFREDGCAFAGAFVIDGTVITDVEYAI